MASKLAFIFLAALAVVMVTAEFDESDEPRAYRRFMGFLERRDCIKPCQGGCNGLDSNCCIYKNTGKHGRCRTVSTYPYYQYKCIHPDFHWVTPDTAANDDCGIAGK